MDPQTLAMLQQYQQRFQQPQQSHYGVAPMGGSQAMGPAAGVGAGMSQLAQALMLHNRMQKYRNLQPIQVTAQKIPVPNQGMDTSAPVQSDAAAAPVTE